MTIGLPPLALQADELYQLQLMYQLQDILNGYVIKNILLVNSSFNQKFVSVFRPNLYKLATQYYGDADLWTTIAQANNLVDPQPDIDFLTILIPPKPSITTGGVLSAFADQSSSNFISSAQS